MASNDWFGFCFSLVEKWRVFCLPITERSNLRSKAKQLLIIKQARITFRHSVGNRSDKSETEEKLGKEKCQL